MSRPMDPSMAYSNEPQQRPTSYNGGVPPFPNQPQQQRVSADRRDILVHMQHERRENGTADVAPSQRPPLPYGPPASLVTSFSGGDNFQPTPRSIIPPSTSSASSSSKQFTGYSTNQMADRIVTRTPDEETEDGRIRNREAATKIRDAWIYKQIRARQV